MEGYLGETPIDIASHPVFASFTPTDWAMKWIAMYGGIDGEHHKTWVLDQVARILLGAKVDVEEARWENGHSEYRYSLAEPPTAYAEWVDRMLGGTEPDGSREYGYDVGIPP